MRDDIYKVEGDIVISGESKELMNLFVLQLLDKCGIRKTEEIKLAGKKLSVVSLPRSDEKGIVRFDYSIFERQKREIAEYDTNTCLLTTPDRGYQEFGVVMNMIMVLQVLFSDSECRLMKEDKECPVYGYLRGSLPQIILKNRIFKARERSWNPEHLLYKRFLRENEDEFLEFWDTDDLVFSDQLAAEITEWTDWFKANDDIKPLQMEEFLAEIISDMYADLECRLVDKAFVTEFLEHRDDKNYQKALWMLRSYIDEDLVYFPELTRRQAVDWMLKENRNRYDRIVLSALQSLLVNHKKRKELFGF